MKKYQSNLIRYSMVMVSILLALIFGATLTFAQTMESPTDVDFLPGDLELSEVPNYEFETYLLYDHKVGATQVTVPSDVERTFIIDDARGSKSADGWTLSVSLGEFKVKDSSNSNSLPGAQMQLLAPQVVKYGTQDNPSTGYPATLVAGDGNYYKIFTRPSGLPTSSWVGTIPGSSISFRSGASSPERATHVATMMWRIENTP